MPIVIQGYRREDEKAVDEFNQRLQANGASPELVFYRWAEPRWLPPSQSSSLFNEFFIAGDCDTVRGGYALKHQNFLFPDGHLRNIGFYHHPLSEGIVNKSHAIVGTLLLRDAMMRSPLLFCLGMGGYDKPLPQMLVKLGWSHCVIPFYFRVLRPARFLRNLQAARTSPLRNLLMDAGAFSGAGWAALKIYNGVTKLRSPTMAAYEVERISEFTEWTDLLWDRCQGAYSFTAVRDCATLRQLYPGSESHLIRLRVRRNGEDLGWAVVGSRRADPKYGSMRVGSIIDCLARPEDALAIVRAAWQALSDEGMDLIVSNQSHPAWCQALRAAGFLRAKSNFIFAASKKLAEALAPFDRTTQHMHLTRADGDGLPRNY